MHKAPRSSAARSLAAQDSGECGDCRGSAARDASKAAVHASLAEYLVAATLTVMRASIAASITATGFAISAPAAEPEITREHAVRAIQRFREADPLSNEALGLASIVVRFVEKDPKLRFVLTEKSYPIPSERAGLSQNERLVLLGAYMVGNLRSCLRNDTTDEPYAGSLQVIETYGQIKKLKPHLRVPEIEKLIELKRRGELKRHVSDR